MSRIGKKPIPVPKGVTIKVGEGTVEVKGPKGSLRQLVPPGVSVKSVPDLPRAFIQLR